MVAEFLDDAALVDAGGLHVGDGVARRCRGGFGGGRRCRRRRAHRRRINHLALFGAFAPPLALLLGLPLLFGLARLGQIILESGFAGERRQMALGFLGLRAGGDGQGEQGGQQAESGHGRARG